MAWLAPMSGWHGTRVGALLAALACGGCRDVAAPDRPLAVATVQIGAERETMPVGSSQRLTAVVRDASGSVLSDRTVTWSTDIITVATVSAAGVLTALNIGAVTVTASVEGREARLTIPVTSVAPVVLTVSPAILHPGRVATLTGRGFTSGAAATTVTIGGRPAEVRDAADSLLRVVVPCSASGIASLQVTNRGAPAVEQLVQVQVPQIVIGVGASVPVHNDSTPCVELPASGTAHFLVTVFSTAESPSQLDAFELVGDDGHSAATAPVLAAAPGPSLLGVMPTEDDVETRREVRHAAHLQEDLRQFARARSRFPGRAVDSPALSSRLRAHAAAIPTLGTRRRFTYIFGAPCSDTSRTITARAIRIGTRSVIWEDTANALPVAPATNVATYVDRLGAVFDAEQYDVVRRQFGDPLRRDAETDGDARVHLVLTQRLNATGVGAYVASCDQLTKSAAAGSNVGEIVYASVPTQEPLNPDRVEAPDGWYAFMSRTVVHELKHIASFAARVERGSALEAAWLEEATARIAEEAWARQWLYRVGARGNVGFGTAATGGVYCDFHTADAACLQQDPVRRPSWGMRRHFNDLRSKLLQPWDWSPFGDGPGQTGAAFYNTAWSLVRFAADRVAPTDSTWFRSLTESGRTGLANLAAASGQSPEQLLGQWGVALATDDHPDVLGNHTVPQFDSWNLRDIYRQLHEAPAWRDRFSTPYLLAPTPLVSGGFTVNGPRLRGGGHAYYSLLGARLTPQRLHLREVGGERVPARLRSTITRLR